MALVVTAYWPHSVVHITVAMRMSDPLTQLSRTIAGTHTLQMVEFQSNTVFHTPLEERFERVTRLARKLLNVSVVAITVLDEEKQWFKSVAGWNVTELPLKLSLCKEALGSGEVCIVEDLTNDHRFWDHPLVVRKPKFRFYASYPLQTADEGSSGSFCILDTMPRTMSGDELQAFIDFGEIAQTELLTDQRNATVTELISKLGVARRAAMLDELTKVWNRQGADHLLRSLLAESKENGKEIAICMLDVDRFKHINDSFGHPVGDDVLRKLASNLVRCLRPSDIVCRMGGDEFMLILPEIDPTEAEHVVSRVHSATSGSPIRTRKGIVTPTLSIGYATTAGDGPPTARELIERADQALLECKQQGRNQTQIAV